jgi:hypothetical protein
MRSRRPLLSAVLAIALLAGQWLAAAHQPEHALQAGADSCVVCVYAHGAGAGALPAMPVVVVEVTTTAPEALVAPSPLAATVRNHPIRGPPAFLV